MDFMKVLDQTVREIKREVNLKVLKVPEIEQKVLDATDNEPWGPHGSALAEIAQATKKFTECQMVMNVLWTRLGETGRDWRLVYKALAVIEYLIANGSERAVDEIIEHTFQISSLTSFEHAEPSGKDLGINVRKKAETIVSLLNNKDKIQEVRNKAAANRDKYFGLSSSGVTYKSGSASYGSHNFGSSSFQSSDRYGGLRGAKEGDMFKDSYKDTNQFGEEKIDRHTSAKSYREAAIENQGMSRKGSTRYSSKDQDSLSSVASKPSVMINEADKYSSVPSQSSNVPANNYEDDFDDFDPRGTSSTKSIAGSINQVDLFGQSLVSDLMDAPAPGSSPSPAPSEASAMNSNSLDVDLFADATFVSASPSAEAVAQASSDTQLNMMESVVVRSAMLKGCIEPRRKVCGEGRAGRQAPHQDETKVDLFASQPASSSPASVTIDFFAPPVPVAHPETKSPNSDPKNTNTVDPFAAVPLNSFDGSDLFGAFTSHADSVTGEPTEKPINNGSLKNLNGTSSAELKPSNKKDTFQVKSGIWADSLSRGLIDLNISAPKKVSLADVGVVGGLSDGSDEREKVPATMFMGRAMGAGSGLAGSLSGPGRSAFPSTATGGDDIFSNFSSQQNSFSGLKK
ncbi:clathrin interactor EPSIN 1 isoform X1 [Malania oleifera]|uniref:clathrin interactor EPSIN 1 isoform X1 n=1 Tax=Malania oleifera TaxID=397392 RepID=UPI0025ADB19A|nr:clathrin interactor EPSIN 1 isoform X1 [Malania oleifera]